MIVLDEQLLGANLEQAISKWYQGNVCFITDLRPNSIIKGNLARFPASVTDVLELFLRRKRCMATKFHRFFHLQE